MLAGPLSVVIHRPTVAFMRLFLHGTCLSDRALYPVAIATSSFLVNENTGHFPRLGLAAPSLLALLCFHRKRVSVSRYRPSRWNLTFDGTRGTSCRSCRALQPHKNCPMGFPARSLPAIARLLRCTCLVCDRTHLAQHVFPCAAISWQWLLYSYTDGAHPT